MKPKAADPKNFSPEKFIYIIECKFPKGIRAKFSVEATDRWEAGVIIRDMFPGCYQTGWNGPYEKDQDFN